MPRKRSTTPAYHTPARHIKRRRIMYEYYEAGGRSFEYLYYQRESTEDNAKELSLLVAGSNDQIELLKGQRTVAEGKVKKVEDDFQEDISKRDREDEDELKELRAKKHKEMEELKKRQAQETQDLVEKWTMQLDETKNKQKCMKHDLEEKAKSDKAAAMKVVDDFNKRIKDHETTKSGQEAKLGQALTTLKGIDREIEAVIGDPNAMAIDPDVDMTNWSLQQVRVYLRIETLEDIYLLNRPQIIHKLKTLQRCHLIANREFRELWLYGDADWRVTHGNEPKILSGKDGFLIEDLRDRLADYVGL